MSQTRIEGQDAALDPSSKSKECKQICRFYNSRAANRSPMIGCRSGSACRYAHEAAAAGRDESVKTAPKLVQKSSDVQVEGDSPQHMATVVDRSRIVPRPISKAQAEDPREFQIGQLRRRFSPTEESSQEGSVFHLKLTPSDPDFPFEMEHVFCSLTVPSTYPYGSKPSIRVTNKELKRGFQINIERGFAELSTIHPDATLLGLFNRLDKELETLLSKDMAETVKFVRPERGQEFQRPVAPVAAPLPPAQPRNTSVRKEARKVFSSEQKLEAQAKRQSDMRQVVARLGRLGGFVQHADGVTFTLPLQPLKKDALPISLQNQSSVRLIVPELYNLDSPRVELPGNDSVEARQLEHAFVERARLHPSTSLLAHINYLSQHAHIMAVSQLPVVPAPPAVIDVVQEDASDNAIVRTSTRLDSKPTEKGHVHVIPRPPEWSNEDGEEQWSSDESIPIDEENTEDETFDEDAVSLTSKTPMIASERGILVSFPGLELYSVELLELVSLNITVKCDRCKDSMDILRLKNNATGEHSGMKEESCKKCANNLAVGYRMDLIHQNSSRAGYLDMDGCTVIDMLPSNFIPTCSECSTPFPAPGIVAVRGDASMAICRECHHKMSFKIPEIKFLRVSATSVRASQAPLRKKVKENLGIVAGQELPQRGRCKHYAKSYRWFRFSCCQRVFACDKCHDEASDHPEEHANRMLCGYCSREQNYSPEQCHFCHSILIGKRGHGFWEGGKGTRDRTKMSRKDPRKYKRRPQPKKT